MKCIQIFLSFIIISVLFLVGCSVERGNTSSSGPLSTTNVTTAVPTPIQSVPDPTNQLLYEGSRFFLQYPITLSFYENERPSADGVISPLENSIALQDSSFLLTVTTFDISPGTGLTDFVNNHVECLELSGSGGQPAMLGNLEAKLYPDTLCGFTGITYLYAVQGITGYRLAIESGDAFAVVRPAVQPILDSFKAVEGPSSITQIDHNGISLSYDLALLGDTNIQDVPASADQGMFGQPTPAHTWIGFVPGGIVRDISNHWSLLREPQVIVFNLNDFGSFAHSDAQALEKIAAFQQLLEDRPIAFDGEIPIVPLINTVQMIHAGIKWMEFGNGVGVRFVAEYSQDNLPQINDRLMYIFFGITDDGLHGITAVFPITNLYIPEADQPLTGETPFSQEQVAERIAALTAEINDLADTEFTPGLSQLDALVQSITIIPTETDYLVTAVAPQNAQVIADSLILDGPDGENNIGNLSTGDAVVVNGSSIDGRYSRILCSDGSTGNCWLHSDAIQITVIENSEPLITNGGLIDGQVVQIQALIENVVFAAPNESAAPLGSLLVGEVAEVYGADASEDWYNIACPRNIGVNCWVIANSGVNKPTGFYSSDGWKEVTGQYVRFRVPIEWNPTVVPTGVGTVLEHWNLGIPSLATDQEVAFSAVAFDALKPDDLVSETPIEIGGQVGLKWVRSGTGYVSYDYYTIGIAGAGSFGVHVTISEADSKLEAILDMLAASIIFTPINWPNSL